jgi:hypothetical protein
MPRGWLRPLILPVSSSKPLRSTSTVPDMPADAPECSVASAEGTGHPFTHPGVWRAPWPFLMGRTWRRRPGGPVPRPARFRRGRRCACVGRMTTGSHRARAIPYFLGRVRRPVGRKVEPADDRRAHLGHLVAIGVQTGRRRRNTRDGARDRSRLDDQGGRCDQTRHRG